MNSHDIGRLVYLSLILMAVSGWVLVEYRGRMGVALRTAAAWGLIFVGLMAGFGLWNDLRRDVRHEATMIGGQMAIPRSQDGHYYITLTIAGKPVDFLVDTGATNVVLSQADATRLGIDVTKLAYIGEADTANGTVQTARVKISDVVLGPWHDVALAAYVNDGQMDGSLLGMDYLGQFHLEMGADQLVLSR